MITTNKKKNNKKPKVKTLGEKIVDSRKSLGYTQTFIHDALGLSISYISKVERNEIIPARKTAVKLAGLLQMELSLFGYC